MREANVSHGVEGWTLVIEDVPWLRVAMASAAACLCVLTCHRLRLTTWGNRALSRALDTSHYERARLPLTTVQARSLERSFVDTVLWWRLVEELYLD